MALPPRGNCMPSHRIHTYCVYSPTDFTEFTELLAECILPQISQNSQNFLLSVFSHRFHRFTQMVRVRVSSHRFHRSAQIKRTRISRIARIQVFLHSCYPSDSCSFFMLSRHFVLLPLSGNDITSMM